MKEDEIIGLELEFVEQLMDETLEEQCPCPNPDCKTVRFRKKSPNMNYIVEYDPAPRPLESNLVIKAELSPRELQRLNPLVFNGLCKSNLDFAKVLNMVII